MEPPAERMELSSRPEACPKTKSTPTAGPPLDAAPQPEPLIAADPLNERGSLVLEEGATFVQAVAASAHGGGSLVQDLTTRVTGLFLPSRSRVHSHN